jgi:excisionase family DNA binding protein
VTTRNTNTAPSAKRLVSMPVAAEYIGCSEKTIRRRIADGTLQMHRFGPRLIRVDLNELDGLSAHAGGSNAC